MALLAGLAGLRYTLGPMALLAGLAGPAALRIIIN